MNGISQRRAVVFTIFASHAVPLTVTMTQGEVKYIVDRANLLDMYFLVGHILIHNRVIMYQTTGKNP